MEVKYLSSEWCYYEGRVMGGDNSREYRSLAWIYMMQQLCSKW